MKTLLLMAWMTLFFANSANAEDTTKTDVAAWQGKWQAISMETDGKQSPADDLKKISLSVQGTDYTFRNGDFQEHGTYRFLPNTDPRQLDIVVGDGADKGKVYLVIYRVEGDRLTICLRSDNKQRPTQFTGKAGSGQVLEVWQRSP